MSTVVTSIQLISSSDSRKEAWINSRPTFDHSDLEDPAELEKLTCMDLSMNSIAQYVFDITSSVKFRDFLLCIRPIAPWCRSLRSAPLTREWLNVCGPSAYEATESIDIDECLRQIANGVPQDKARNSLPMSLATTYTVALDHRTLVSLLKSMNSMFPRMFLDQGVKFLTAIGKDMEWLADQRVKPLHESYIMTAREQSDAAEGFSGTCGEMLYSAFTTTYTHAAQIIRMHHAKVKTTIWNEALREEGLDGGHKQDDPVGVVVYADHSTWVKMLSLRSHWFAEWNSWSPVVRPYLEQLSISEMWDFIPNGGGRSDPYSRDMLSRIALDEINLPCPIMCQWPALVEARRIENGDCYLLSRYKEFVDHGYIVDNPSNQYRIDFIYNLGKKIGSTSKDNPLYSRYVLMYELLRTAGALA